MRGTVLAPMPRRRGESAQLVDSFAETVYAAELMRAIDMLPHEKKAHEVGRAERLDFGVQAIQRVAMNPCQETTVAPFELVAPLK